MLLANTRAGTAEPVGRHKDEGKTDLGGLPDRPWRGGHAVGPDPSAVGRRTGRGGTDSGRRASDNAASVRVHNGPAGDEKTVMRQKSGTPFRIRNGVPLCARFTAGVSPHGSAPAVPWSAPWSPASR